MQPSQSPTTPWFRALNPSKEARVRLFCFHHAGGSAALFRTWPKHLPPEIEVWPVLLPGRERRMSEPAITGLGPLCQALAQQIRPLLDRPYSLFGHSLGALLSFELTRLLVRIGVKPPTQLLVSSFYAPQLPRIMSPIHALPDAEFLQAVEQFGGIPEEAKTYPELLQLMLPTLRADFELLETYKYRSEPALPCPISAFGGSEDPLVTEEQLAAWQAQTSGACSLQLFPGGHFYLSDPSLLLRAIGDGRLA